MKLWNSIVGKLWMTIIGLVALVLLILGFFLIQYIDRTFANSYDVKRLFVYTAIIGFLLTTFFAFFLSTRITQPLMQLKRAADMIRVGRYDTRVPVTSHDEIGELSRMMNHMAEELEETIRDLNGEKEHLSGILTSMTDAVITFDAAGRVLLANPQGEQILGEWRGMEWMTGDGEEEEEGEPRPSAFAVPEPLRGLFSEVVKNARGGSARINVLSGVWSVVMAPLYANANVRGVVAVLRDVTEEYRLEKLRKDFVANVSHELRTPISMLQGYSEALVDDIAANPDERQEIAQIIHEESLRMGRLVKDLLDLARMESGHFQLSVSTVDLRALLSRIYRKFSVMCRDRGIALELSSDEGIVLPGDEDRLEQVLTNLLDNAIRHTPEGKRIVIRARLDKQARGKRAIVEVQDFGKGIPEADLPYIFERFYKADKARTRGHNGGTGLGLSIVKNIVEAHGGEIEVTSALGEGTTFSLALPAEQTAQ